MNFCLRYRNRSSRSLQQCSNQSPRILIPWGSAQAMLWSAMALTIANPSLCFSMGGFCLAMSGRVKPMFPGVGMFRLYLFIFCFCTCYQHNDLTLKDFKPLYKVVLLLPKPGIVELKTPKHPSILLSLLADRLTYLCNNHHFLMAWFILSVGISECCVSKLCLVYPHQ